MQSGCLDVIRKVSCGCSQYLFGSNICDCGISDVFLTPTNGAVPPWVSDSKTISMWDSLMNKVL